MPESVAYECRAARSYALPRAVFEEEPSGWDGLNKPLPLTRYDGEWRSLSAREPLLERISDPGLSGAARATMETWGERTCLTVPLLAGSHLVGLLAFYDQDQERCFTRDELAFAAGLGTLAAQAIDASQSQSRIQDRHSRLTALLKANRAISASLDVDEILETLGKHAVAALDCDSCDMYSAQEARDETVDPFSADGRLQVLQQRLADADLAAEVRAEMTARGQRSRLVIPLSVGRTRLGTVVLSDKRDERVFSEADVDVARGMAEQAALAINNARRHKELRDMQLASLGTLVGALGAKEPYTQGHAARVAQYVALIGAKLGWHEDSIGRAEEAAIMHDVGKLAVSDSILLKPGPLSEGEWKIMRAHPEMSEEILHSMMQPDLLLAIRHHHERYDGKGYPDGLAREAIPLFARAICVADAYDAMSFRRPYRHPLSYSECRAALIADRGSQFDPRMVDALLSVLDDLARRREYCLMVAERAAALIDAEKHKRLQTRADEDSSEYREIEGILRSVMKAHDGIRYLTTLARGASRFKYVVDPEERERTKCHLGDEIAVPDDGMIEAYTGEGTSDRLVLGADEFGVWVNALAPIVDRNGETVAVVRADSPARASAELRDDDDHRLSLASLLGEARKRIARAEFEAVTDGLTGVYNHRYLHEHLEEEISRSTLHGASFVIFFIDIDHFKRFNDVWGHSVGDAALRAVAQVIQGEVRRGDVVARYGGEEFVAVLAETTVASGLAIAERIRQRVALSVLVPGTSPITVSIGVAAFPSDARTKPLLLERGDAAMYQAKRLGRNRVQAHSSLLRKGFKERAGELRSKV